MTESSIATDKTPGSDFQNSAEGRSTPAWPLTEENFEKIHLALAKGEYDQVFKSRNHLAYGSEKGLGLIEIVDPTTDDFLYHLQRVGSIYGWDKREFYQQENRPYLDEMISQ